MVLCFSGATVTHATPVVGNFGATGGALSLTGTPINPSIDFFTLPGFVPSPGTTGNFLVGPATTGSFGGRLGEMAIIKDLATTLAGPLPITNFIVLPNAPGIVFHLTSLDPGVFSPGNCASAPAAGQGCTLPGSAFSFLNTSANTSTASFNVRGTANFSATPGDISNFSGVFTMQFSDMSYQALFAALASGATVATTFSASFTVTPQQTLQETPEPATLLLLGTGLVVTTATARRRHNRRRE